MLYSFLRGVAAIALRWFYREIRVEGAERIPTDGAVLLAVNHPNALIDAMVAGIVVPRRVLFTGKATLFQKPLLAALLRAIGVVPLRRVSDELAARRPERLDVRDAPLRTGSPTIDASESAGSAQPSSGEVPRDGAPVAPVPTRNADAFQAVVEALSNDGLVLVFPEGKSHDEPSLAPLRSGTARMALQAHAAGVHPLTILPLGLIFERKEQPRTRILVRVGQPIPVNDETAGGRVEALTARIDRALRDVTLNFESTREAEQLLEVAETLAAAGPVRRLPESEPPLSHVLELVSRAQRVRETLADSGENAIRDVGAHVASFLERLGAFRDRLRTLDIAPTDVGIDLGVLPGVRFVVREGTFAILTVPLAWWGRINHWLPLHAARGFGVRGPRDLDQPAMRTVLSGLVLVVAAYALQTAIVWKLFGAVWAIAYLVSLPIAGTWDFRFSDRLHRAGMRMRAYLAFRANRPLYEALRGDLGTLSAEAERLEREILALGPAADRISLPVQVVTR